MAETQNIADVASAATAAAADLRPDSGAQTSAPIDLQPYIFVDDVINAVCPSNETPPRKAAHSRRLPCAPAHACPNARVPVTQVNDYLADGFDILDAYASSRRPPAP